MTNNKPTYLDKIKTAALAALVIAILAFTSWLLDAPEREILAKVQSSEAQLSCLFQDGWRVVEPGKVKDFYGNTWIFTNGSASRCEVSK